jgi:cob(I)alamin adenosyltransferase
VLHIFFSRTRPNVNVNVMKIYTKTGDGGSSSLYNGERRQKTDAIFSALGDVDEMNSVLGIAREYIPSTGEELNRQLEIIQSRLLDIGSCIATPDNSSESKLKRVTFSQDHVEQLEEWIDAHAANLPALTQFILPSGGKAASHLHLARSVCRRSERSTFACEDSERLDQVTKYLNRLSDYLFTAARVCAVLDGRPEVLYRKAFDN